MSNLVKQVVGIFALCMVYTTSSAAGVNVTGQRITRLATGWGGEGIYVDTTGTLPSGVGCGDGNKFIMQNGILLQKENISILISAFQGRNTVDLYTDGCDGTRMILKAVATYPAG